MSYARELAPIVAFVERVRVRFFPELASPRLSPAKRGQNSGAPEAHPSQGIPGHALGRSLTNKGSFVRREGSLVDGKSPQLRT